MLLRRLIHDDSGASAAEYALIVAVVGVPLLLASLAFGSVVQKQSLIRAEGPDGTMYQCTANCEYDFKDYCAAAGHMSDKYPPTFSPALPTSAPQDCAPSS